MVKADLDSMPVLLSEAEVHELVAYANQLYLAAVRHQTKPLTPAPAATATPTPATPAPCNLLLWRDHRGAHRCGLVSQHTGHHIQASAPR